MKLFLSYLNKKALCKKFIFNFAEAGHFQAGGLSINLQMEGAQVGFVNVALGGGIQMGAVKLLLVFAIMSFFLFL